LVLTFSEFVIAHSKMTNSQSVETIVGQLIKRNSILSLGVCL